MGVAADPFHSWGWEPKTKKDRDRLLDNEWSRRLLHPDWHRERDKAAREGDAEAPETPTEDLEGSKLIQEPEGRTGRQRGTRTD